MITSKSNKTVTAIRKLWQKKYRQEQGLFIAEGVRTVKDIAEFAPHLIDGIYVSSNADCQNLFPNAVIVEGFVFDGMTETVNNQGVLAVVKMPTSRISYGDYVLFLDGIRDPGNIGTLIRTACAAGYNDIFLKDCADVYSGKVVRSTMSAIVKVNLLQADDNTVAKLKSQGYKLIGADMCGKNLFEEKLDGRICVVIGGEAFGISERVSAQCDNFIRIPMVGDIESLNAAVSGAIIMYNLKFNK